MVPHSVISKPCEVNKVVISPYLPHYMLTAGGIVWVENTPTVMSRAESGETHDSYYERLII